MPTPAAHKPPHVREITPRSVTVGLLVALVIGASYPYVVLKFGFGPNISVVSAFFGFMALGLFSRNYNRWENNIVQTAGTTAGQISFLCWLLAAGLLPSAVSAQSGLRLEAIDVQPLPGQQVELRLRLSGPAPEPMAFTIDTPARISLDLPNTALGLESLLLGGEAGLLGGGGVAIGVGLGPCRLEVLVLLVEVVALGLEPV